MIRPHFSPEVTLGHVLQATVIVFTVGGGIVSAYVSLRTDLERERAEFQIAAANYDARLTNAERELADRQAEDREFRAETRDALSQIMNGLADLRTQLVQKEDRK
jgi:multidrug resistance efflux pump